jgi:hypothetical protein
MPSIIVSEDVVERIRGLKLSRNESEDETLRRILDDAAAEKARRLKAYETIEQDTSSTN